MSKRFEWHSYYKRMVLDTKTNKIIKVIDTLNQQDQQLVELKADNEMLKSDIKEFQEWRKAKNKGIKLLQQQLKDNTKQVCEKISKNIVKYVYGGNLFDIKGFKEFLDQIENEKESN